MIENITEAIEGLTVFPEPETVFVPEQLALAGFMDPLVTIDLSLVNPQWSGVVHLLSPVEPYAGLVGMRGSASWNDLVRENWLAFAVEDGRYRFLTDENYFTLPQLESGNPAPASADWGADDDDWVELRDYYARQRASFDAIRTYYRKHGELQSFGLNEHGESDGREPNEILEQLGGAPGYGNWVETVEYPVEVNDDDMGQVWPLSPSGKRFEFVAAVAGYNYRESGADWILLFYQPEEQLALITFDWT